MVPANDSNEDIVAIKEIVAAAERLQDDPAGFADLLTPDAVLVNAVGRRLFGRAAVRDAMTLAMATPLAAVRTTNEVVDIRFIQEDVALVSAIKHISNAGDGSEASRDETATLTFVMVREDGGWLVALAHNTLVPGE